MWSLRDLVNKRVTYFIPVCLFISIVLYLIFLGYYLWIYKHIETLVPKGESQSGDRNNEMQLQQYDHVPLKRNRSKSYLYDDILIKNEYLKRLLNLYRSLITNNTHSNREVVDIRDTTNNREVVDISDTSNKREVVDISDTSNKRGVVDIRDTSNKREVVDISDTSNNREVVDIRDTSNNREVVDIRDTSNNEEVVYISDISYKVRSCQYKEPHFLQTAKPLVALASFPGSGNSWTRELIESLTGVYTGSVYIDRMGNFSGSKRCPEDGSVFIIKTHRYNNYVQRKCVDRKTQTLDYEKVIFISRNPYNALLAEFNRRHGGKIGFAKQSNFHSEAWRQYVTSATKRWSNLFMYWLDYFGKPHHLLIYEHLKSDLFKELYKVAIFLQQNVTDSSLYCITKSENTKYLRVSKPSWLNKNVLFDKELRYIVNSEILKIMRHFENMEDLLTSLQSYIL